MRVFYGLFLIVLVSCQKYNEPIDSGNSSGDSAVDNLSNDSFYFKATLNGEEVFWLVPSQKNESSFSYQAGASVGHSDFSSDCSEGFCYYVTVLTQISKNVPGAQPQINIGFNMASMSPKADVVSSWFLPGEKMYQTVIRNSTPSDLLNPDKNGLFIHYIDQDGKSWSSNWGSQHGSNFQSIKLEDQVRKDVPAEKVWKAAFSCILYDDFGNSINLEDGEIFGPILPR